MAGVLIILTTKRSFEAPQSNEVADHIVQGEYEVKAFQYHDPPVVRSYRNWDNMTALDPQEAPPVIK